MISNFLQDLSIPEYQNSQGVRYLLLREILRPAVIWLQEFMVQRQPDKICKVCSSAWRIDH